MVYHPFELPQIVSFRGSKSRNKVSVGEPADGSLLCTLERKGTLKGGRFLTKFQHCCKINVCAIQFYRYGVVFEVYQMS